VGQALLPTYTEVTTLADRDLYTRHGYIPLEPFSLPDGSTTYPMWRTPRQRQRRDRSSPARPDQPAPTLNDLPPRLILDTSAILTFTEGSTAVGEAIAKVADEGCLSDYP
jgi:hypothetical protein